MQYKTHLAVSLAVGIPLMSCAGDLNFPNAMALCAGTLLPDIDHPGSYMGKRNKFISKVANKTLGHRGGTHSLLFAVLVYAFFVWIRNLNFAQSAYFVPFWILCGYLMHLSEDSFSKDGVNWLWPLTKHKAKSGGKFAYYSTGKLSEVLIFLAAGCVVLLELKLAYDGNLKSLTPGRTGEFLKYSIEFLKRVLCLKT